VRSFGIFVVGAVVFTFAMSFPSLEPAVEALAAIAIVTTVAYGFALHPHKDVFYVRTTTNKRDLDRNLMIDHDQLAVRVETARLWLLFIPTALAVAFLVVTWANGTLWRFSLVETLMNTQAVGMVWIVLRAPIYIVGLGLSIWIAERRALRNAKACSARSYRVNNGRVGFQFVTDEGRYSGGDDLYFGLVKPREVATLIFYDTKDFDRCKIGMGLLFHRIVLLGHGLPDLDRKTATAHQIVPEVAG
jgi:hypothetical protein